MHIKRVENNKNHFTSLHSLAGPLGVFHNRNAAIPTLIIESGVTTGRTMEAYKKTGKIEATERLVEQGTSAVVWLWGVQAFKKIGDIIGSKIFKIKDLNFDVGFDYLRNPLENISKKAISYKVGNILTSTALATIFIGFILPKINHLITKNALKNEKKNTKKTTLKPVSFNDFQDKTKNKSDISFTSLSDKTKYLAHLLENDSVSRLLITDSGVVSGRFHNGRNKYEKIENIFRDVSSIYFYLFSTKHIVKLLNKLTSNTDINPDALKETVKMLNKNLEESNIDKYNFLSFAKDNANIDDLRQIDKIFSDKKVIDVEEFKKIFPNFASKADSISRLQPELKGKYLLTKSQAQDVVSRSWASDENFLHSLYNAVTKGNYNKKEKFVSAKEVDNIRTSVNRFMEQVDNYAKQHEGKIDKNLIEKIANKNIIKNFAFYSIGTAISIFALGILIPKIQYFIRRKLTHDDEFVGIKNYK